MGTCVVACLVECQGAEICKLHFNNGFQATQCCAHADTGDSIFGNRGVEDAARVAGIESLGSFEGAAKGAGYVFAQQKDVRVFGQQFIQRLVNGIDVGYAHGRDIQYSGFQAVARQSSVAGSGADSRCACATRRCTSSRHSSSQASASSGLSQPASCIWRRATASGSRSA